MKFWQSISWMETDQQIEVARFSEEVGFHGVMHGDHFAFPQVIRSPYPMAPDGRAPMGTDWDYPDCWVTMAAQAAVTTTLKLATGIYTMPTRHPIITAKATGTLALLSDHRVVVGVAPGWMKEEFDAAGIAFEHRGARLDEAIAVVRKLWAGGPVEHHGRFYDFDPVRLEPMPGRQLPIYIGGNGPAALRRAATLGEGWIGVGDAPEAVPDIMARLSRLRAEAERAHLPFETIVPLIRPVGVDELRRLEDQGMTSTVAYPFALTIGARSTLDAKKRAMEQFANSVIHKMTHGSGTASR